MTILAGDIKLLKSKVMLDVPEGGGPPTDQIINDGTSNGIFPDISELDRAGGRVNLRKVFASVQTTDTDGYFGANVIVSDPPDDPLVSVTLFSTDDVFDVRDDAQNRMESYLAQGPLYSGYLFGNHIAGMAVVTLLQREEVPIPVVGDTFVLRAYEGTVGQVEQYVRVKDVSTLLRTFTDTSGDFKRMQVTLELTDVLRYDLPGFDAIRYDSSINYTGKTKTYSTIVADAARYFGVVPLEDAAAVGDFTVQAEGIFSQLVPSTRVEVPIADARMNQQSATLVKAGDAYSRSLTLAFTTSQSMFIGGNILPGSLMITRAGITLIDRGGILYDGSNSQVGTIDYENGVAALSTNVFGAGSGTHTVTYTPATAPTLVSDSIAEVVTSQGQRLSWTYTLNTIPARGSLQVSYRALGRWYVLREDGSGVIKGSDSAFGAGTLNFTTGTISVTLGALPDVDSSVVFTFASASTSIPITELQQVGPALGRAFGKVVSLNQALEPGSLSFSWNDGSARTASDSGGTLSGFATGTVDYTTGQIMFRPNLLPPVNTAVTLTVNKLTKSEGHVVAMTDSGATWTFTLGGAVKQGTVEISVLGQLLYKTAVGGIKSITTASIRITDDGAGNLITASNTSNKVVGTISYVNGNCSLSKTVSNYEYAGPQFVVKANPFGGDGGFVDTTTSQVGITNQVENLSIINSVLSAVNLVAPTWGWWSGPQANSVEYRFSGGSAASDTYNFTVDQLFMPNNQNAFTSTQGYSPKLVSFFLGSDLYVRQDNLWISNPSPTTGLGTTVGADAVVGNVAGVMLTAWNAGGTSAASGVAGSGEPIVSGIASPLNITGVTFRTSVAPLLNSAFQVAGNWLSTGSSVSATANSSGQINTGSAPADANSFGSYGVFGVVDYEMGICTLVFGRRAGATATGADIIDISDLGVTGVSRVELRAVQADTLRYNAVGYSYLPLDADILGLDPVRLPADGRVPIFRPGSFAVIGHTGTIAPATYSNGNTINCGRVRLSRVRLIGNDGQVINTGYTADLDAGTILVTSISGWSQPVKVEHRIEDMMLVRDAQINGQLTFTRQVTHVFPVPGSYVSSALVIGDMQARVSVVFDQSTWTNVWSDEVIGSSATGTYNDTANPIEVTNKGALTERWAIQFTNSTSFIVIGEHVGVIATGSTGSDCAPINPATGLPYFTLQSEGWGLGWATGNVLRFNTVGACFPVWMARTILQGPETVPDDAFTVLIRGDVDRP